jgi:drug/metabolite transporter (DMT)-like permease
VLFALLSLAAIPVALYSTRLKHVNLPQAVAGEAVAGTLLGLIAVLLARSARRQVERTLGRVGEGPARAGKWLGLLGVCLGLTAALALAFFGLLLWSE